MLGNGIKRKLGEGEPVVIVSGHNSPDILDQLGPLGFDAAWIDTEHGNFTWGDLGNIARVCDLWDMASLVRVTTNEPSMIMRTLDQGVDGIIVPHVNTREEAQNVVNGGKFPPIGLRGVYTGRQGYGVSDYHRVANDETLLIVLIEDIVAVQNLDEILDVDHIDVFLVAPSDLSASMGHIGDIQHPDVQETLDDAHRRIVASGRMAGALARNEDVEKYVSAGVGFLLTPSKHWIVAGAAEFRRRSEAARS